MFTTAQWKLVEQEKLIVTGAPFGPAEMARSKRYVFALPPRWNYDEPGVDEANQILASKPPDPRCASGVRWVGGMTNSGAHELGAA